jgi:hypothetical protein
MNFNGFCLPFFRFKWFLIKWILTVPEIHPKYDRISYRKYSNKYKLLTSNHEITMKIYGVRLGVCIFWNIFGPKYDRILGVFRVYVFQVRLGDIRALQRFKPNLARPKSQRFYQFWELED